MFAFCANGKLNEYERMLHRYKSWDPSQFVPGDMIFSFILRYLKPTYWDSKAPIKVRRATDLEKRKCKKVITKAINEGRDDVWEPDWIVRLD